MEFLLATSILKLGTVIFDISESVSSRSTPFTELWLRVKFIFTKSENRSVFLNDGSSKEAFLIDKNNRNSLIDR